MAGRADSAGSAGRHRRDDPQDPPLLIHPLGELEGRQRVVPLETNDLPRRAGHCARRRDQGDLGQPTLAPYPLVPGGAGVDVGAVSPLTDHFDPASSILSAQPRPAIEDMLAGVRLGANGSGIITTKPTPPRAICTTTRCSPACRSRARSPRSSSP